MIERTAQGWRVSVAGMLVAALLLVAGTEFWAIRILNDGSFLYSLDDAYIHLSLAQRLQHGHYGINASEPSSPSSSILWPELLVPLAGTGAQAWVPLVLNLAAALGAAIAIARMLERSLGRPDGARRAWLLAGLGGGLLLLFNTVGLLFTGLEHSLQVWLTLLTVLELHDVARGALPCARLWGLLVLGPLVRYENLAVTLPGLVFLGAMGHRRAAGLTLGLVLALLGAFSAFLVGSGLPPLPCSVLAKQMMLGEGLSPMATWLMRLRDNLFHSWSGPWFALLVAVLAAGAARATTARARAFAIAMAAVPGLHLAVGGFGMFHRYELYALAAAVSSTALVYSTTLRRWFDGGARLAPIVVAGMLLVAAAKSAYVLLMTPAATHEIYRQQFQMRRFAQQVLPAPAAVNDLGLVAFGNTREVVDLWGLANPEALAARRAHRQIAWADSLCRREGVVVAMIYAPWFGSLPATWTPLGALQFSEHTRAPESRARAGLEWLAHRWRRRVAVSQVSVDFFAIRPEDVPVARAACERFRCGLVDGVTFLSR